MDRLDPQTTYGTTGPVTHGGQGAFPGGAPTGAFDPWRYRDDTTVGGADLTGYKVEATDGGIGKVDSASHEVGSSFLVVDTGPWIFGKKVMIPAGVVNHVDHDDRKVYVDRSKDQIKAAPEYDEQSHADPVYRDKLGGYYNDTYSALPQDPLR
ncbi:PRC-barrel domain-containing protein [Micromonospora echinofusca]|uniref:PRC-barrel domain containing protein n=1 Tax=Micromonospora echinofusca TaxID=47858 RepID=A0ABS3VVV9_MICEH|nr:PRC-barrel domain-containing protein [Micromonospora echinofusca]MBO4208687.1 PRC-barrel domain containing protein [Micromonospora echinofusca]